MMMMMMMMTTMLTLDCEYGLEDDEKKCQCLSSFSWLVCAILLGARFHKQSRRAIIMKTSQQNGSLSPEKKNTHNTVIIIHVQKMKALQRNMWNVLSFCCALPWFTSTSEGVPVPMCSNSISFFTTNSQQDNTKIGSLEGWYSGTPNSSYLKCIQTWGLSASKPSPEIPHAAVAVGTSAVRVVRVGSEGSVAVGSVAVGIEAVGVAVGADALASFKAKFTSSQVYRHINIYVHIYIYVCVCMCVSELSSHRHI